MQLRNKIQKIRDRLEAEGKVIRFTDEQQAQLWRDIHNDMEAYRAVLARQMAQSVEDTSKIVLNA